MESKLQRLIDVYAQERRLYGEILRHVRCQRELIDAGAGYAQINAELARKRELLQEVEALERGVREDRELWRQRRHELDGGGAKLLLALLAEVTVLVEEILERERENEILLTTRRRRALAPLAGLRQAAASYRRHGGAEVKA